MSETVLEDFKSVGTFRDHQASEKLFLPLLPSLLKEANSTHAHTHTYR